MGVKEIPPLDANEKWESHVNIRNTKKTTTTKKRFAPGPGLGAPAREVTSLGCKVHKDRNVYVLYGLHNPGTRPRGSPINIC